MSTLHDTAPQVQGGTVLLASGPFQEFAPQPAICCSCLNNQYGQARTYVRAWDNRLEMNFPASPFLCCTCSDKCVLDRVFTIYYDKQPFRSDMVCYVCPITCCGPPVLFLQQPKCCFGYLDLTPCLGAHFKHAPFNCFGLKSWLVCGQPCYVEYSQVFINSLPGPEKFDSFLSPLKQAVAAYQSKHNIPVEERVIFEYVTGGLLNNAQEVR